jgi:xylulokinase
MALLGIDVGTSTLKTALYGEDGDLLAVASHEHGQWTTENAPGFHPQQLWEGIGEAIGKTRSQVPDARIRAVSISSHGESFVPIDANGQPLGHFILNTDSRCHAELGAFTQKFGRQKIFEITGLPVHPSYTLPKIAWIGKHRPDVFAKARKYLCVEDFILHRAGVGCYISTSLASRTMGLSLATGQWSPDLIDFAGIDAGRLAQPVQAGTPLGRASPQAARELNLPADALWVAGGHDQGCCSLGAGGVLDGVAVDGTGTFECLSVPMHQPRLSAAALAANFPTERHTAPGMFLTLAYTPAGVVLKWFRDTLSGAFVDRAAQAHVDPYALMLEHLPEAPTGLFVFPHLIGTGTPWLDADAQGAILGLTVATTYAEMVKAVLEGISCEMRWNLQLLDQVGVHIDRVHAVGGGSKSTAWLQMKADVFDCEVVPIDGEASCAGAAMCAGLGAGIFSDCREAAAAFVRPRRGFTPRPEQHAQYQSKTAAYQELAERLYGFSRVPAAPHPDLREEQ